MVAFGHTALGSALGIIAYQSLGNGPLLEGLLITSGIGIASHYIADCIPHGHFFRGSYNSSQELNEKNLFFEYKKHVWPVLIYDLLLSIIFFLGIPFLSRGFDERFLYVFFGISAALLPDVLDGLIYIGIIPKIGLIKWENKFHLLTHWHGEGNKALLWDLKRDIWQITVVVLSFFFSFTYFP